jgi:hypothetical protein
MQISTRYLIRLIALLVFIPALLTGESFAAPKTKLFFVDGEFRKSSIEIRVNDIPMFLESTEDYSVFSIPVNSALVAGKNNIKITISPENDANEFSKNSQLKISIFKKENVAPGGRKTEINSISFNDLSCIDKESHPKFKIISLGNKLEIITDFNVGNIFPRWAWQDGSTISDTRQEYDSLIKAYERLHKLLESKNKTQLDITLKIKIKDFAEYNFTQSTDIARNKVAYDNLLDDQDAKLLPLWEKKCAWKLLQGENWRELPTQMAILLWCIY